MEQALSAATVYFLGLFALGFVLRTMRVVFVVPRFGTLIATAAEVPVMLAAAFIFCRWVTRHWRVPDEAVIRWAIVWWFLMLLLISEALLGALLFSRTPAQQWAAIATPAGLLGLSAQITAALLPDFTGRRTQMRL